MARTRSAHRPRTHAQQGAAAAEFAVVAPILILLVFGTIYFGLYIYRVQVLESATREAARVASLGGDAVSVEQALDTAAVGFAAAETMVTAVTLCELGTTTARVETQASGDRLNFALPFYGSVTPVLTASATFECEQQL